MSCKQFQRSVHMLSSPQQRLQSAESVPRQPLSFSISRILGLSDKPQVEEFHSAPLLKTCYGSPQRQSLSHPEDRSSESEGGWESEGEATKIHHERLPSKKRQRTTFSPIEIMELERAFMREPYLTSEDERDLVQRLGIPSKSLKYWFQNRRAKSKKEERMLGTSYPPDTSSQSNLFGHHVYRDHSTREQPMIHLPSDPFRPVPRMCHSAETSGLTTTQQHCRMVPRPVQRILCPSNRLTSHPALLIPRAVFKAAHRQPARIQLSRSIYRYQPY